MMKEDIEIILKQKGWKRTMSAPENVIDYQEFTTGKRILVYDEEAKFITEAVLEKLMEEKDVDLKLLIMTKAQEDYEAAQVRLVPTQEEEIKQAELKVKKVLKDLVDKLPYEKLQEFASLVRAEFSLEKTGLEEIEKESKIPTVAYKGAETAIIQTHICCFDEDHAKIIEGVLQLVQEKSKDLKSAVINDTLDVRAVMVDYGKQFGNIHNFKTKSESDAKELIFIFDSTLKREIEVTEVTRIGEEVTVKYRKTGWSSELIKKKTKRFFEQIDDFGNRYLVDEDGKAVGPVKPRFKKGEGGEEVFVVKKW